MQLTPIVIAESVVELRSRRIRIQNTQNLGGVRTIDVSESSDGSSEIVNAPASGIGGRIQGAIQQVKNWIIDKGKQFVGFIFASVVNFLKFNFTQLWGTLVTAYFAIKTFDWNQADSEIEEQIEKNNARLIEQAAGPLGQLMGWGLVYFGNLAVGSVLGAIGKATGNSNLRSSTVARGIKVPVVSGRIAAALAEEGSEEVRAAFTGYFRQVRNTMVKNSILSGVLNGRKLGLFGGKKTNVNAEPDTFVERQEKWIKEKIPTEWQNFVEEFIDEFEDSIIEAGYVVSHTLDDHYAAMRLARQHEQQEEAPMTLRITNSEA